MAAHCKTFLRILLGTTVFYIAALALLFIFQRNFLYFPDKIYLPLAAADANERLQEWPVKTEDGLNLKGWYAPAGRKPFTLVFFHGNADTLRSIAPWADPYIAAGYGFLIVEYRSYSGNPGTPTETGLYNDARAFIRTLIASGVPEKNIILFGHSLGTGVATQMATEFKTGGLILLAPYMSIAKMAQIRFPFFPAEMIAKDRFESWKRIKQIHMPLLLAHGESDFVVPTFQGKELFALANEPKELHLIPHGGHSDLFDYGFADISLKWLEKRVKENR